MLKPLRRFRLIHHLFSTTYMYPLMSWRAVYLSFPLTSNADSLIALRIVIHYHYIILNSNTRLLSSQNTLIIQRTTIKKHIVNTNYIMRI